MTVVSFVVFWVIVSQTVLSEGDGEEGHLMCLHLPQHPVPSCARGMCGAKIGSRTQAACSGVETGLRLPGNDDSNYVHSGRRNSLSLNCFLVFQIFVFFP